MPAHYLVLLAFLLSMDLCMPLASPGEYDNVRVRIVSPEDLSRPWIDYEAPEEIRIKVEGAVLPRDGVVKVSLNGRGADVIFESEEQRLVLPDLEDGVHVLRATFYDKEGIERGTAATSTFFSRRYLELIVHEDYPIAAEAPRGDGSAARLPGVEEWDMGGRAWDDWGEQTMEEALVRRMWAKRGGNSDELPWDASKIFRVYADFHQQVMSNQSLWSTNDFLIYRTMDRGMGNQLESLVSSFVLALVTNRVFLVDSTTIHHVLKPPKGLRWHYSQLADSLDHDLIYRRSKLLDLRWQNKLEFPNVLCKDIKQIYQQQFLFVFSDQYFLPAILHNNRYRETVRDWFGEDLFGTIGRYLIAPKSSIMAAAVDHYRTNLEANKNVGIQLRTATMKGHDIALMAEGMHPFAWKDWVDAFFKCSYFSAPRSANSSYFISTDNARVHSLARNHLGADANWIQHHVTRSTIAGHADALIDIVTLSLCDDLVVTTMSTFGYLPAALSSITPLVVTYHSTCYRDLTSQPCFHKWSYLHDAECYDRHSMVSPEVRFCGIYIPPEQLADGVW